LRIYYEEKYPHNEKLTVDLPPNKIFYYLKRKTQFKMPNKSSTLLSQKKMNNSFFKKYVAALEEKGITRIDDLMKLTCCKKSEFFTLKNSGWVNEGTGAKQTPFKINQVKKFCFGCNISPKMFLVDPEIENKCRDAYSKDNKKGFDDVYFTRNHWNKMNEHYEQKDLNPGIWVKNIPPLPKENNSLVDIYIKLADEIENLKESLIVHELLFKGNNETPGELISYKSAQEKVFDAIQLLLESKKNAGIDFKYKRYFHLSPEEHLHKKSENSDKYQALLIEASLACFIHMVRCLKLFPDLCEFYIAPVSRFRSHSFLDNDYLLTEDYIKYGNTILPTAIFYDKITHIEGLKKFKERIMLDNTTSHLLSVKLEDLETHIPLTTEYLSKRVQQKIEASKLIRENCKNFASNDGLKEILKYESEQKNFLNNQRTLITLKNHYFMKL